MHNCGEALSSEDKIRITRIKIALFKIEQELIGETIFSLKHPYPKHHSHTEAIVPSIFEALDAISTEIDLVNSEPHRESLREFHEAINVYFCKRDEAISWRWNKKY